MRQVLPSHARAVARHPDKADSPLEDRNEGTERNSLIEGPRWPVRDRFTELNSVSHHGGQNGGSIDPGQATISAALPFRNASRPHCSNTAAHAGLRLAFCRRRQAVIARAFGISPAQSR